MLHNCLKKAITQAQRQQSGDKLRNNRVISLEIWNFTALLPAGNRNNINNNRGKSWDSRQRREEGSSLHLERNNGNLQLKENITFDSCLE